MAHNGKLVQVNLSDPRNPTNYPFMNLLKGGREWTNLAGLPVDRTLCDVNGYPTSLPVGEVFHTHFLGPTQTERPGNWVIAWDGSMTCITGIDPPVSGSYSGTNGRAVFTPVAGGIDFKISVVGSPPPTNIRICHIDDEAALASGEIFNTHWLTFMQQFGLIRDLGWSDSSFSNLCRWVDRKPVDYWSYYEYHYPAAKLAGSATYVGTTDDDYTLTFVGFTNTDRNYALVKFPVAQPHYNITAITRGATTVVTIGTHILQIGQKVMIKAVGGTTGLNVETRHTITAIAATTITVSTDSSGMSAYTSGGEVTQVMYLNINGLGAKEILQRTGRPRGFDTFVEESLVADRISHVSYDAILDGYLVWNGNADIGVYQRVPHEVFITLCNKLSAHAWFTGYYQSLDARSDFVTNLATLAKATLNSGLKAYYEPPNETWNFQYVGTNNGMLREIARTPALNSVQAYCEWIGRVASYMGQDVNAVYAGDTSRYAVVCAFQTYGGAGEPSIRRLTSPVYVSEGGTPAYSWITHIAIANYWHSPYYGTATESTLATTYAQGAGGAPGAAAMQTYMDSFTLLNTNNSITEVQTIATAFHTSLAVVYDKKMAFYEGGYSPDFYGSADIRALLSDSRLHPDMETSELLNMHNMVGISSRVEFPSFLGIGGSVSPWGLVDDLYDEPTDDPRWRAVLAFNPVAGHASDSIGSQIIPHGKLMNRRQFRELKEAMAAQRELEAKAQETRGKRGKVLVKAARVAERALEDATVPQLEIITSLMQAATRASSFAATLRTSIAVQEQAQIILAEEVDPDEEEAVTLLLLS